MLQRFSCMFSYLNFLAFLKKILDFSQKQSLQKKFFCLYIANEYLSKKHKKIARTNAKSLLSARWKRNSKITLGKQQRKIARTSSK